MIPKDGSRCGLRALAFMNRQLIYLTLFAGCCYGQRSQRNPLGALPKQLEVLTHFGERADISPDNQRIAFMDTSFGDAFVIDLKTRIIRCLTCSVPATAFLKPITSGRTLTGERPWTHRADLQQCSLDLLQPEFDLWNPFLAHTASFRVDIV
jgi:hypothetical protein